jgi:MIP family channel proteins
MNITSTGQEADREAARPVSDMRLHGHALEGNLYRAVVAEAVGTMILVLAITAAAVTATLARPIAGAPYGSLAVVAAGGLVLAVIAAGLGPVSGGHVNPAVTFGLAVSGRFPWAYVIPYVAAQFTGAVAAAAITWGLYGDKARSVAGLGATYPPANVAVGRVCAAEAVGTFVLVLVVVAVATDDRVPRGVAALAIGAALATSIVVTGAVSGAGLNPARAIGPMILVGRFTDWWAYLIAPLAAGALSVTLYDRVLRAGRAPG